MNAESLSQKKSSLSVKGILLGGLVGGLVGAIVRGGITVYNLREGGELGLLASLPDCRRSPRSSDSRMCLC